MEIILENFIINISFASEVGIIFDKIVFVPSGKKSVIYVLTSFGCTLLFSSLEPRNHTQPPSVAAS